MKHFFRTAALTLALFGMLIAPGSYLLVPGAPLVNSAQAQEGENSGEEVDIKDWETPYDAPKAIIEAFQDAEESGTCWDTMNAKLDLLLDETRYWSAEAVPGSEGSHFIDKVLSHLLELQLAMGKNRIDLESADGNSDSCEGSEDFHFIQGPLEDLKLKMRKAGWLIDQGEDLELTDEVIAKRCSAAEEEITELGGKIDTLTEKLATKAEDGDFDGVSNAKELLNMAQQSYGDADIEWRKYTEASGLEEQMRACSGARDAASLGLSVFRFAHKFHNGDKKDKSGDKEEIDAKIKMFLDVIAQKRLEALARSKSDRTQILEVLGDAQAKIVEVQIEFAKVKYDKDTNLEEFDALLEEIKATFKPIIDELENTTEQDISKKKRRASAKKLLKKSRKQIKTLNKQIRKKDKLADDEDESDIVQFAEQTAKADAQNARLAAKAFRRTKKYENAQLQALHAIETAKSAKEMLKEVE